MTLKQKEYTNKANCHTPGKTIKYSGKCEIFKGWLMNYNAGKGFIYHEKFKILTFKLSPKSTDAFSKTLLLFYYFLIQESRMASNCFLLQLLYNFQSPSLPGFINSYNFKSHHFLHFFPSELCALLRSVSLSESPFFFQFFF